MSSLFSPFEPRTWCRNRLPLPETLRIETARQEDVPALAALAAARDGREPASHALHFVDLLGRGRDAGEAEVFLARLDGRVVAYGKATYFRRRRPVARNTAPAGWYLGGLVVDPEHRRRRIGLELTLRRLEWIGERAHKAFYFSNARNLASVMLHLQAGFEELTRDFSYPGVTFEGGKGILFQARLGRPVRG